MTDALGRVTDYDYDIYGNNIKTTTAKGTITIYNTNLKLDGIDMLTPESPEYDKLTIEHILSNSQLLSPN